MAKVGSPAQSQIFWTLVPLKIGSLVAVIAWDNFSDLSLGITSRVVFFFFHYYYNLFIYNTNTYTTYVTLLNTRLYHTYNTDNTNTYTYNTNKHYNLKLRKKEPNTIKILIVTKIK